jgi:hypothetical protein
LRDYLCVTGCGVNFQISRLYSPIVLSVENLPLFAQFKMLAPTSVPMVIASFIISFMLPVPEVSLPAADICSDKSIAWHIYSLAETR